MSESKFGDGNNGSDLDKTTITSKPAEDEKIMNPNWMTATIAILTKKTNPSKPSSEVDEDRKSGQSK